jgi:hypothetical protein
MNVFSRGWVTALACAVGLAAAADCRAQSAEATPNGKGIVGGALVGAEVVLLTEAAMGVKPVWAYLVGGLVGAGGGGVAGYFLERNSSAEPPTFLLAGGIALVVPAMIGVLTATQYEPPENYNKDEGADAAGANESAGLALPNVHLEQAFTRAQMQQFGVNQTPELHLSVLRGQF